MNTTVSLAGLPPSTGVPKISRSKLAAAVGWVNAKSSRGNFAASAMACAKRLVFPVLEKYTIHGFIKSLFVD
jgi:hypothetical protein